MSKYNRDTTGAQVVADHISQIKDKNIVITGTSAKGLGAQTAIDLSRGSPSQIFLLARSAQKVQPVIDEITSISPSTITKFIAISLDDLSSVRTAAAEIAEDASKIDILINNAGVMGKPYQLTKQGVESQFGTNHIGHFALTQHLYPLLKAAPAPRVINVSSDGYQISSFRGTDYNFSNGATYDEWSGYGQSKTANILFSKGLAKRGLTSFSLHPGVIYNTGLTEGLDLARFSEVAGIAKRNTGVDFVINEPKSIEQGVSTTIFAAVGDLEGQSGAFLENTAVTEVLEYAKDDKLIEDLWRISEEIVGSKFEI